MRQHTFAIAALLLSAFCAPAHAEVPGGSMATSDCVDLFQTFDRTEANMSTPTGWRDRMVIPPALQRPTIRLRSAGCITMSDDLAPMATLAAPAVTDSGRAIPPTRIHAGAVTSMADDAAAKAFFTAHGLNATSIGSSALGRRIYVGPLTTEGALQGALALAQSAGFASPYPASQRPARF